jgi:uncharacterized repeat protein (TIGR03943 family)
MSLSFGSSANRWRGLVVAAWAAGIAVLLIGGRYSLFVRARLWPLLLASLLILLLFLLAMIARPAHAPSGRVQAATWVRGALLLLPLLYMCNIYTGAAASGLNSFALQKRSLGLDSMSGSLPFGSDSDAMTDDANKTLNLGYVWRHLNHLALTHARVVTEGRVYRDPELEKDHPNEMVVFRFVVVCCAADAIPIQMVVESPKTSAFKNDDWVRLRGTIQLPSDGKKVPVFVADQIYSVDAPDEPYLSPY